MPFFIKKAKKSQKRAKKCQKMAISLHVKVLTCRDLPKALHVELEINPYM